MKTCIFCGHETDKLSCPRCKEYKGLVEPQEAEREFQAIVLEWGEMI